MIGADYRFKLRRSKAIIAVRSYTDQGFGFTLESKLGLLERWIIRKYRYMGNSNKYFISWKETSETEAIQIYELPQTPSINDSHRVYRATTYKSQRLQLL